MRLIALLTISLAASGAAHASVCGPAGCPAPERQSPSHPSVFRIRSIDAAGASSGTATLVGHDAQSSYFLSCAHVLEPGAVRLEVASAATGVLPARVVAVDGENDLSLVATPRCDAPEVGVNPSPVTAGELTACGYGPSGVYRCVRGPLVGFATPRGATAPSLRLRGAVRPGDSGGPVLDAAGRLVAVVWGSRDDETFATHGEPLRRILLRLPSSNTPGPLTPVEREPTASDGAWREKLEQRLGAMERGVERLGGTLAGLARRDDLVGLATRDELTTLGGELRTLAAAPAVAAGAAWLAPLLAALGLGGPVGLALLAGRLLLGARAAKRRREKGERSRVIAVDTPPPPQRVDRETHFVPYQRDDFAAAHQWASEQLARKFPGSVEMLSSLDSLIRQQLAGKRE